MLSGNINLKYQIYELIFVKKTFIKMTQRFKHQNSKFNCFAFENFFWPMCTPPTRLREYRGHIFSHVGPFHEQAVSDLNP
jgi:hypothetical protein